MKNLLKNFLLLGLICTFFLNYPISSISAMSKSETFDLERPKDKFSSKQEISNYIKQNKNVNILVYDESGKITEEYHSDGEILTFSHSNSTTTIYSNTGTTEKIDYKQKEIEFFDSNGNLVQTKDYISPSDNMINKDEINNNENIVSMSATVYESDTVNGVNMNNLITNAQFTNSSTMSYAQIQQFFVNKNSVLQYPVLVYKTTSSGTTYFDGMTIDTASSISSNCTNYKVNPKLIICMLQKESGLVTKTKDSANYDSRSFIYAMGYGATDGGDQYAYARFDQQLYWGIRGLRSMYDNAPSSYPVVKKPVNFNRNSTNGLYHNYVWVDNKATYALYTYTPHTIDTDIYLSTGTIGGGNYLLKSVCTSFFSGSWN